MTMKSPYVSCSIAVRIAAVLLIMSLGLVGVSVFSPNAVNAWYCVYSYSNCWSSYNPVLQQMEWFRLECENCLINGQWTGDICSVESCP